MTAMASETFGVHLPRYFPLIWPRVSPRAQGAHGVRAGPLRRGADRLEMSEFSARFGSSSPLEQHRVPMLSLSRRILSRNLSEHLNVPSMEAATRGWSLAGRCMRPPRRSDTQQLSRRGQAAGRNGASVANRCRPQSAAVNERLMMMTDAFVFPAVRTQPKSDPRALLMLASAVGCHASAVGELP